LHDFLRRSSFIKYDKDSARKAESALKVFAEMEKLDGHGKSFSIRL
jgi:histidinol dehydrogenase